MSPNDSNRSHEQQDGGAFAAFRHLSAEVTQRGQTIDHAPRWNRLSLGIFSAIAPEAAPIASIPAKSPQIICHGEFNSPAYNLEALFHKGLLLCHPKRYTIPPPNRHPSPTSSAVLELGGGGGRGIAGG